MDIILEILDTLLFDRIYSTLLPASPTSRFGQFVKHAASSTFSSVREGATQTPTHQYVYKPASQIINLQPSKWAYASTWQRDNPYRQAMSLFLITWYSHPKRFQALSCFYSNVLRLFGLLIYFVFSSLSYVFIFDKETSKHPKYLKNQVRLEIKQTMISMPFMSMLTTPFFLAEVRGYAKLYDLPSEAPFAWYNLLQFAFFLLFTDFCIYWIHRGLHHPLVYKTLHKPHHKWIMPTPYASHAFHPVDGFSQSLPYHIFPFLFPLQKLAYVALFVFINVWTIFIHDGEYVANSPIINGAACHTVHHSCFNFNFGQYTTLWDRLGGSYRQPNAELFRRETKMSPEEWERQRKETEKYVKEIEGEDERVYGDEVTSIQKKML